MRDRRSMLTTSILSTLGIATTAFTANAPAAQAEITKDSEWPLWTALPVAPYSRRKTIRKQVAPGVWTFDQLIGIYYVHVPIRMTVTALSDGTLFVYAPVAPTRECLALLQPLMDEYGPIRTILLPSVAVEHKVNAGPFARAFPAADFYVTDKQYSFPLNLPGRFLGLPSWTQTLPSSSSSLCNGELEYQILDVKPGPGSEYQDVAVWHRASGSVLLCDTVIAVNDEPPAILTEEPEYTRALLFHARDAPTELVDDTPESRRKGWRRIVLLFNFFFPGAAVADLGLKPLLQLDPTYKYGWGGWLPFSWKSEQAEKKAFDVYKANGKPTVFPIVQIILSRGNSGESLREWVDKVKQWKFERIIPAHLDAPIAMGPTQFVDTFAFLESGRNEVRFCDEDVSFLREAEESFLNFAVFKTKLGVLRGPTTCGL